MALIPAFHEVYGWNLIPEQRQRLHPAEWSVYNPAEHNVDDVVAYLEKVGPRERARVFALEHGSKQRKTVLDEEQRLTLADVATPAGEMAGVIAALNATQDPETPDAAGAGNTDTAGNAPGTSTED